MIFRYPITYTTYALYTYAFFSQSLYWLNNFDGSPLNSTVSITSLSSGLNNAEVSSCFLHRSW